MDEDGSPLMYILNYKNGGFVIISATKDYYPVLAFSDKGSFVLSDQVNGVSIWFNDTKKQIKNSISLNDSIKTKIHAVWNSYESFDNSSIKSRTMNGWYIDANSGSGNYEHSRVNFYLSKK